MKIGIIIPALNAGHHLQDVLVKSIKHAEKRHIYVIDDGSWDETAAIAKNMGVRLHRHEQNQGKGAALKSGFHLVLQDGLDTVITLDSDGQHDPEAIPAFISAYPLEGPKVPG